MGMLTNNCRKASLPAHAKFCALTWACAVTCLSWAFCVEHKGGPIAVMLKATSTDMMMVAAPVGLKGCVCIGVLIGEDESLVSGLYQKYWPNTGCGACWVQRWRCRNKRWIRRTPRGLKQGARRRWRHWPWRHRAYRRDHWPPAR